jgi:hypothetical protein
LKFAFFLLFSFLAVYFHHIQHILGVVSSFCIFFFLFLFESSVSFIFQIDSLAIRETIIAVLFCLFFWYIYIFGLRYRVGFIWCWFQFCKNHKKVRREV